MRVGRFRLGRWGLFAVPVALGLAVVLIATLGGGPNGSTEPTDPQGSGNAAERSPAPTSTTHTPPPRTWMRKLNPGEKPPQFVLFSFDGVGSHEHWQRKLALAREVNARFTGLLTGLYLLPDSEKNQYTGPGHRPGRSSVGFGGSQEEVTTRINDLNQAVAEGHEIGTHFNGHFCQGAEPSGRKWNAEGWTSELDQFFRFVTQAPGLKVDPASIKGGRTPCLEVVPSALFPVMAARGMNYDTSLVSEGIVWPAMDQGVWEFKMPRVTVPGLGRKVILMDYNLWASLNGAKEQPGRAAEFHRITMDAYRAAHTAAFNGNRGPLVVGNHFNSWNGGAFGRAAEEFMSEVCVKADTACVTHAEVIEWMGLQDPAVMDALRALPASDATL